MKEPRHVAKVRRRFQARQFLRKFLGSISLNAFGLAVLVILFSAWLPEILGEMMQRLSSKVLPAWTLKSLALILILLVLSALILMNRKKMQNFMVKSASPQPSQAMLINLSYLRADQKKLIEEKLGAYALSEIDIESCSWHMPVVAINHHVSRLEWLYVNTSQETHKDMALFGKMIDSLYPKHEFVITENTENGIDFENVGEVFAAVNRFFETCLSQGFPAKELVVDVTGGKVPTSIGGVAAILSLGNKFQYVSTTSKKVLWYEIGYFRDEE